MYASGWKLLARGDELLLPAASLLGQADTERRKDLFLAWVGIWQASQLGLVVNPIFQQAQPAQRRQRIADRQGVRIGVGGGPEGRLQPPLCFAAEFQRQLARLRQRAQALGSGAPDHFVFPACERNKIDPNKPQKTWRTARRSLVEEAAKRAGDSAAKKAMETGGNVEDARRRAALAFINERGERLRFHDLRHQAITELAENGAPDATMMALAGHMSREMLERYSHVRMAAKREALDRLAGSLMKPPAEEKEPALEAVD